MRCPVLLRSPDAREQPSAGTASRDAPGQKPARNTGKRRRKKRPASRQERSAGVVVYRIDRSPGRPPTRLFLLLDYGRHWDYPKGHLEKGEDDATAARRELAEETGITDVELIEGFSCEITYHFHSSRKGLVKKAVNFFAGKVTTDSVVLSHEHVGYAWLELEAALAQVTFENARNILAAAAAFLHRADPLVDSPLSPEASPNFQGVEPVEELE